MVNEIRSNEIALGLANAKERITSAAISVKRDPSEIALIVVTKTFPKSDVEILYELGIRDFGENRDQEGSLKADEFHLDAKWHFQGQIQSNKIKSILSWADVIHSLADLDHAKRINNRVFLAADKSNVSKIPILIQVSLDSDLVRSEGRNGIDPKEIEKFAESIMQLEGLELKGLMAVAPISEIPESAFARLAGIFSDFQGIYPDAKWLSAGMSGDFESAIHHGATHVRLGSSILGNRSYL